MDKRYQVFVSSTYADLVAERSTIIQTLMELDCIPSGMELFPAIDEEQWQFIKKVIDDCDYYLLLIGGRYGSVTDEGVSYTEMEFDYAVSKGIRVIAFIHGAPDSIPVGKTDKNPSHSVKLAAFIEKAKTARLVRFWSDAKDLPGLVALNVPKTIKTYPAIGWVRANSIASDDMLQEVNSLRKKIDELQTELNAKIEASRNDHQPLQDDLAPLEQALTFHLRVRPTVRDSKYSPRRIETTWLDTFVAVSPYLQEYCNEVAVKKYLHKFVVEKGHLSTAYDVRIDDQEFQTFKIQMQAHGLLTVVRLKTNEESMAYFWVLTDQGKKLMIQSRIVRKAPIAEETAINE